MNRFRTSERVAAVAVLTGMILGGCAAAADAQVAYIDGPARQVHHNYVPFHSHVPGTNWTYVELRDGAEFLATPCRTEDSTNCWWNACKRGNHQGYSFLSFRYGRHESPAIFRTRRACR